MRVLVTGAAGFVGRGLAARLARNGRIGEAGITELVLADRERAGSEATGPASWQCGELSDTSHLDRLFAQPVDLLFHLASIPGAAAEKLPDRGEAINLGVPLELARRLAAQRLSAPPRIVLASTIAVYGDLPVSVFSEDTPAIPTLSYGAHKLMAELYLADLSRRGEIDARSLRLPGIVARPLTESGHGSAFLSEMFHKARAREAFVCPVMPDASSWWMSLRVCIDNLIHAAGIDASLLPAARAIQLPALCASIGDVLAALERRHGAGATAGFTFVENATLRRLFASMPAISTPSAHRAGFVSDGDVDGLVANVASAA
jgi:nucleoside-diphosphate-sugar epimerase